ncbi:MAG: hypothetical protein PUF12_12990 [Thermoflexaceae bacterium]|nr:hypothetical protein [Thermoflexaceae bacterium]
MAGLIDSSGTQVVSYSYDSWGRPLGMTDSTEEQIGSKNPFRYREYFYDAETGLYYISSRYYDPEVGRFISPDDEEVLTAEHQNLAQYNLYAYCWNNPVNMSDENGDWPGWATKVVIGTVAIAVGVAVTALTGGTALPALIGSLKLATAGAVIGASVGATKHLIKEKTVTGIGKSMLNGAATGYMAGGLVAGGIQVGRVALTKAGSGISLGKKKTVEMFYHTPETKGGTILSVKKKLVKSQRTYRFRLDLDIENGLHFHSGVGKAAKKHRRILSWLFK